jgi:hypothetical protein
MRLTPVEDMFKDVALIKGGVFLLKPGDAVSFVENCRKKGVSVAGVEGFRIIGDKIQPFQEHSTDLINGFGGNPYESTIAFISKRQNTDLWFEVVTTDRNN